MEKSSSDISHTNGSGDEGDDRLDEEEPTTSKGDTFSPEQISHNMNDLKALDFNSADEVRRAMKSVLAGKLPPQSFSEETNHVYPKVKNNSEPVKINELGQTQAVTAQDGHKTVQRQVQQNLYQKMKTVAQVWSSQQTNIGAAKKRPGRPQKAGPSNGIKKVKVASMYLGKLSNVVPFKRSWESESGSESDVDSVVLFY